MTVIAYRAGYMACDSCWTSYGTQVVSAIKIIRLSSGALLGCAGDNDARAMIELLDKIKDPRKLPARSELEKTKLDFEGLIAFPRGGVYVVSTGPHDENGYPVREDSLGEIEAGIWPATTMGGYAAVGCGATVALGAMDAGASAAKAVEIACRRDIACRPPVHVLRLNPSSSKLPQKSRLRTRR